MQQGGGRRAGHRDAGEEPRPDLADHLLGEKLVEREGERGGKHEGSALRHVAAERCHFGGEDERQAEIADGDADERRCADRLREEERAEDHDESRIGEEDQPLELRGDVNEAEEIRVAGEPVAEHADEGGAQHEPRGSAARGPSAASP